MINVAPGDLLLSYGRWLPTHVAIVVPVYGEPAVFESTDDKRPECGRTHRENPKGVQAHTITDWLNAVQNPHRLALRRGLYDHELDRLVEAADSPTFWASRYKNGADYVADVLREVGIFPAAKHYRHPLFLVHALVSAGIYEKPFRIT